LFLERRFRPGLHQSEEVRRNPKRRRNKTFSARVSTEAVREEVRTPLTAQRSHHVLVYTARRRGTAYISASIAPYKINIIHHRLAISTGAKRRQDVYIAKFYWLFKKHVLSARLVSALVESKSSSSATRRHSGHTLTTYRTIVSTKYVANALMTQYKNLKRNR
jgi:hypothetical protein